MGTSKTSITGKTPISSEHRSPPSLVACTTPGSKRSLLAVSSKWGNEQNKIKQGYQHQEFPEQRRPRHRRTDRHTWLLATKPLSIFDKRGKKVPYEMGYFWLKCKDTRQWRKAYQTRLGLIVNPGDVHVLIRYGTDAHCG